MARIPKNYRGVKPTSRQVKDLLPGVLQGVERRLQDDPRRVLTVWADVVGEKISAAARAESFVDGVLTIRVRGSALLSLLARQEKGRLLKELQKRLPKSKITNILFRLG